MSQLALKMQKAAVLPTVSGFYSYAKSGMANKLNALDWFPRLQLDSGVRPNICHGLGIFKDQTGSG